LACRDAIYRALGFAALPKNYTDNLSEEAAKGLLEKAQEGIFLSKNLWAGINLKSRMFPGAHLCDQLLADELFFNKQAEDVGFKRLLNRFPCTSRQLSEQLATK